MLTELDKASMPLEEFYNYPFLQPEGENIRGPSETSLLIGVLRVIPRMTRISHDMFTSGQR